MTHILPLDPTRASAEVAPLLEAVKAKMGRLPNLILTLAQAPASLRTYLAASEAMGGGKLDAREREVIALAVAEANGCDYCLGAHTAIGKMVGLDEATLRLARVGRPADPRQAALAAFSRAVVQNRGHVSPQDLQAAREAGLTDQDLLEGVANVAVNILTNYTNQVAGTVLDFPRAPSLLPA